MSGSAAIMDASLSAPLLSTPTIEVPATPHPQHAELPADIPPLPIADDIPPSSAQLIPNSSQETEADLDSFLAPIPSTSTRSAYHSPTPPSASMTPPPSTQPPKRAASPAIESAEPRDLTPTPLVAMSSPPATVSRSTAMLDAETGRSLHIPPPQQLEAASVSELRQLLAAALHENSRLITSEKEARMSAAHHKLQHNLLQLETEETTNRLEVEHEMMRREVEVLQQAELARRDSHHTQYSSSAAETVEDKEAKESTQRYISDLKAYADAMAKENAKLVRRFERAKKVIADKEDDIKELSADNKRLLERIRQNREHIHLLTSQGGIYASPQSQSMSGTRTVPSTPNYRERGTPRQTPGSARHTQQIRDFHHMQGQTPQQLMQHNTPLAHGSQEHHDRQDSFATLLLADRVLNDQNSAPTTPRRGTAQGHQTGHGHPTSSAIRHHRAAQSLSSLPIPQTARMQMQTQGQYQAPNEQITYGQSIKQPPLLSPPQIESRQSLPGPGQPYDQPYLPQISPRDRVRRRKSRDSTISASDEEERAQELQRVSPYQGVRAADPFTGYAPVHRSMVQALPQSRPQSQAQLEGRPTPSPRYQAMAQQVLQVDDDETEEEHPEEVESDIDIPASQASLSASAMLRRDPRESFEIAESPRTQQSSYGPPSNPQPQTQEYRASHSNVRAHPPLSAAGSVTEKGRVLQAKIFGSVTKPGMEGVDGKRKRLPSEEEIRAKRLRVKAREGLGLGLEL